MQGKSSQDKTKVEVAPEIYKALAEAEAARNSNGKAASAGEQAELVSLDVACSDDSCVTRAED